jgi:hypothetical protein
VLRRRGESQNNRDPAPRYDAPQHRIAHKTDAYPESLCKTEKSIWEHYNEMAAVEDNIREVEWQDLADTILVFVCLNTL